MAGSTALDVLPPVVEHSPTIVNTTRYSIVVFLERGTLYNRQVLKPGEALSLSRKETGGGPFLPYRIHAVIGDETSLPTKKDSIKNLVKVSAIPATFVAGCLVTAISAGMLIGPSVALAPLVSGMVVKGVVIDSAALAAGGIMASRAQMVAERLLKEQPEKFMLRTGRLMPGRRFVIVKGGLGDGPVEIDSISKRDFQKIQVKAWKRPLEIQNAKNDTITYLADENKSTKSSQVVPTSMS